MALPVIAVPNALAEPSLVERMAAQQRNYWKIRSEKTLERLEREARRMLMLEEELSGFAMRCSTQLTSTMERISALEEQGGSLRQAELLAPLITIHAQVGARESRRVELKKRYRSLAKEIHPDRHMLEEGAGRQANHMHRLNAAHQKGDLAALLKLEAELVLLALAGNDLSNASALEMGLREIERAADTYGDGYRALLHAPINKIMLRAYQARHDGWDWVEATISRLDRALEEAERALALEQIIATKDWAQPMLHAVGGV